MKQSPYRFFFRNAGYSYKPPETPLQGRARCAHALAVAERKASNAGCSFEWSQDDILASEHGNCHKGEDYYLWQCLMRDPNGKACASLGGVDFGPNVEPWGKDYRRVVEAELAMEWTDQDPA